MQGNGSAPIVRVVFACTGCAARPLRLPRSIDRQRALSPAAFVTARFIHGRAVTITRTGDLYEDRGARCVLAISLRVKACHGSNLKVEIRQIGAIFSMIT